MVASNPFSPFQGRTVSVDDIVGDAYPPVKTVAQNIEYVKHVSVNLETVYTIYTNLEPILALAENIPLIYEAATTATEKAAEAEASAIRSEIAAHLNEHTFSLERFGADPTGTIDSSAAIQAAIDYAHELGGGKLIATSGLYLIGSTINMAEDVSIEGQGSRITEFRRTANITIFKHVGPSYELTADLPWYSASLSKMQIRSAGTYSATMVDYIGATYLEFDDVLILGTTCTLLSLHGVWDSRFINCKFHEGGTADGTKPSLLFKGGYDYRPSKELFFNGCVWENYAGKAIDVDAEDNEHKAHMIGFNQCKFESLISTKTHVDLYDAYLLWFDEFYVTDHLTPNTLSVIRLGNGDGYTGNITVAFSVDGSLVAAKAAVQLENARYVNLAILMPSTQPVGMWAVDWDTLFAETLNLQINAAYPTVNGRNALEKTLNNSTVKIVGSHASDVVQLSFEKTGRISWTIGAPTNPSSTNEDISIKGGGSTFLTFRSSTATPASAKRSVIPNANFEMSGTWNTLGLLKIGTNLFWFDSVGKLRRSSEVGSTGIPSSETAGFYFLTNQAGTTGSRPSTGLDVGQLFFDTTLNKPIWRNSANNGWVDATGTAV